MPTGRIACVLDASSSSPSTELRLQRCVQLAEAFSPRVEEEKPGVVFLDVGAATDERAFARALLAKAERSGLAIRIGLGAHKHIAELAARTAQRTPRIISSGLEAAFLKPLPVALLDLSLPMTETLRRWGIRTIGELAGLPPKEMMTHLGKEGWTLHLRARGIETYPFIPESSVPLFFQSIDLEWPIADVESFTRIARELLEKLSAQLVKAGLACRELVTELRLDPQGKDRMTLKLRVPTHDAKILLQLLRLQLVGRPPRAPITGLTFTAEPDQPRQSQLSLFGPTTLSPARIAATLLGLAVLIGSERSGSPEAPDGHTPERFSLGEFDPPPAPLLPEKASDDLPALLAVRIVRPPLLLTVETAAGFPRLITSLTRTIQGNVQAASGPWVLDVLNTTPPIQREYWDAELSDGGLYRLYREPTSGQWFADGIYD